MHIAAFMPNWVGDVVMATPALRALRTRFPQAELTAVVRPPLQDLLAGTGLADRCLLWNPRGTAEDRGWGLARRLRAGRFDLAVLFPNSVRSAAMAWLSGARQRVGMGRNGRSWLLTNAVSAPVRHVPTPALDEYLRIVAALGCQPPPTGMELAVSAEGDAQLAEFWRRHGAYGVPDYVCLNNSGAFGSAKLWPVAQCVELARKIAWKLERRVLVLCGPAEREQARAIVEGAQHPGVVSLAEERLSLGLSIAAVARAQLLVTTDSGPRHFAPPFGVPAVTLFGPTHQAWSATGFAREVPIQLDLACGPCQQRTCPLLHHRCMQDLGVDRVFRSVSYQLNLYAQRSEASRAA